MSSGFISESEILEARRRRQEEWDKVRTEDQPKEAPEEVYDTRPLYTRLEEQRMKKEADYEEAHKLKNMIRGLDDDEVGFLDLVEQSKAKAAQMISIEEQKEMQEFRERVSTLAESEEMTRLRAQLAPARTNQTQTNSQKNKLQGVVVRKRKANEMEPEKEKEKEKEGPAAKTNGVVSNGVSGGAAEAGGAGAGAGAAGAGAGAAGAGAGAAGAGAGGALRVLGVLPGLGPYDSDTTSDTDDSSDDETDKCCTRDILGRRPEQSHDKRKEDSKS